MNLKPGELPAATALVEAGLLVQVWRWAWLDMVGVAACSPVLEAPASRRQSEALCLLGCIRLRKTVWSGVPVVLSLHSVPQAGPGEG